MEWTWKYFDMLIVVGAVAIGIGVWFIPNFTESDKMKALEAAVAERREAQSAAEAEKTRKAVEQEELGIVYFGASPAPAESR
jgi:hypothetical protein